MDIDIYSKFNCHVEKCFSYVDAETSTPDDWNFKTEMIQKDFEFDCKQLLDYIKNIIDDEYFSDLRITGNKITINTFNFITGEGDCVCLYIERKIEDGTNDLEN